MHVHANYSQQLATMGAARDEVHEMAARRAAEVRRRLAAAESLLLADQDEVVFVKASPPVDSGPGDQADTYSQNHDEPQLPEEEFATERGHGSLFSARA